MSARSDEPIDAATDFEELAARLRTQSDRAPGSDTDRVTIRSLEDVRTDSLVELLEAAETDHDAPGDLVFVLSRTNVERLLEREFDTDDVDELEDRLGRTVQVEGEMPDDTILLLAPDAIDGESITDPESIACGILGTDHDGSR
ncbi:hypothetical protein [Natronolimnohabitans innermongolicus]|uniref:Uncharacterized protein n=1 Tax=Natronolimnohabitans innermongolicus JCM 12255 TaxID=1227499 RepID=L9WZ97_9EURY|nr:hypothetical protein [Natronolimnohabitans innermongolicus]ELY53678.1 hypothetical protein C493_13803 [Natronolimnohabitans innermongolicus JCM 12255]